MSLFTKQKHNDRHRKQNLWLPKGKQGGGISCKYGVNRYTQLYIIQINNKVLLYSTWNNIQDLVINYNGKRIYIYVHICIPESLCCTSETNAYYKSTIFQFKKLKNNKAHL